MRRLPWARILALAAQLAREGQRRWRTLPEHERQEVTRLLRKSRGRPGQLTQAERSQVRDTVMRAFRGH
jgi:hypothetical protein